MLIQYLLLLLASLAMSSSLIFIKSSEENYLWLAAWRLLLATLIMSPVFFRELRRRPDFDRRLLRLAIVPGWMLALHFVSWIPGARLTLAANASLIVNMVPLALPFILHGMLGERLTRREGVGTGVALAGVVYLALADYQADADHFRGDLICFGSMLVLCLYMALARRNNRRFPSVWLYIVPLYLSAGLFCVVCALATGQRPMDGGTYTAREVGMILGLAIVPTVIGHSLLNNAMKRLRGQTVALINQLQTVFAAVLAYLFLAEEPRGSFYLAAILILGGAVCVLTLRQSKDAEK